jgi:predicted aspartyl protease
MGAAGPAGIGQADLVRLRTILSAPCGCDEMFPSVGEFMRAISFCAALAVALPGVAFAEDCGPLKIVGQADMISTQNALLVPASVNGISTTMIIDTGGWYRQLFPVVSEKLNLPRTKRDIYAYDVTGRKTDKTVTVSDFELGTLKAKDVPFYVPETGSDDSVGGLMGPQLLMTVDVDFDFGGKKINFVLQDHCEGKVVYWKTPSYAVVPFILTDQGHIRLPVELDGKKFTALLDTGAFASSINMRAAEEMFALTKDSPGVTKSGFINGDKHAQFYKYTFKTLTVGGITFNNPTLAMIPDLLRNHLINAHRPQINSHIDTNPEAEGLDDVTVGLEELRHLHVYIAYKEKKLYISPASADEPPSNPAPSATGTTP